MIFIFFQQKIWFGSNSVSSLSALEKRVEQADLKVQEASHRNEMLSAELNDLKERLGAIEERARTDLGMIQDKENFVYFSGKEATAHD